ncbi:MAG: hypothetical protein EOO27_44675, partial [Comamonadaceae bacterium]
MGFSFGLLIGKAPPEWNSPESSGERKSIEMYEPFPPAHDRGKTPKEAPCRSSLSERASTAPRARCFSQTRAMNPSFWGWLSFGLAAFLALVVWSIRRHRAPVLQVQCDLPIDELVPSLAGLTLGTAVPGNSVELFENGAFFDVLLESIGRARHSVHFETFLWKEGKLGQRVADALSIQARAGRKVRVLLDATGSRLAGKSAVQQMRDAGCTVKFFHKRKLLNVGVLNDRDHRKIVIVDGREAFAGGHCIVDDWLGNAEDGKHFADVSLRLRGPIVHSVQSAFSENWGGETGELFVGNEVFPE